MGTNSSVQIKIEFSENFYSRHSKPLDAMLLKTEAICALLNSDYDRYKSFDYDQIISHRWCKNYDIVDDLQNIIDNDPDLVSAKLIINVEWETIQVFHIKANVQPASSETSLFDFFELC